MSVELAIYRVRIGLFCCCQSRIKGVSCLNTFEFYTWLRIILLKAGDIEQNPGPPLTLGTDKRDISRNIDKLFSFVHYNVQSALPKIDLLSSELSNFDVISLTETWLSDNINSQDINITGFHPPLRYDRPNDNHGGVAVYVKETFPCSRRPDLELPDIECVWIELQLKNKPILIGTFYRPPNSHANCLYQIENSIGLAIDTDITDIIVAGDLNLNANNNSTARKITNICRQANLDQIINEPTHFTESSESLIDLIMVSNNERVILSGVGEPFLEQNVRYHCPVFCILNFQKHHIPSFKRRVWKYQEADFLGMKEAFTNTNWNELFSNNTDLSAINITNHISNSCSSFIPNKIITVRHADPPWFHNGLRTLIRKRKRAYDKAKRSNSIPHWNAYKKLRNETISLLRQSKQAYKENLAANLKSKSLSGADWWKVLKSFITESSSTNIPPLKIGDKYTQDEFDKAEALNTYFISQTYLDDRNKEPPMIPAQDTNSHLSNIVITTSEVADILLNLETGKACGPDGINNIVLKNCANELSGPLSKLFNQSLQSGVFPNIWKEANVAPIFKKNNPSDPSNYRPISLLSTIGKAMEKVIHKHVFNFFRDKNLLSPLQSGFIPGDSSANELIDIYIQYHDQSNGRRIRSQGNFL